MFSDKVELCGNVLYATKKPYSVYGKKNIYYAFKSLGADEGSRLLYAEINTISTVSDLKRICIPYHIVQGADDLNTPTQFIRDCVKAIDNENIKYTELPFSGHIPTNSCWILLMEMIVGIDE